jgi:hypothetical protein
MKLRHLLSLLHTMEPDATVCIPATGTHAEQIGAVVRLEAEDDLALD